MAEAMGIYVEFFMGAPQDAHASEIAGRPIHKDTEMIRIRWKGDNKRIFEAPATERTSREPGSNYRPTYIEKFPEQYEAFKRNVRYIGNGTPVDEAPFLTNAQRAEFKAINIYTVEDIAAMDQRAQQRYGMGAAQIIAKAKAYIENASGSAGVTALAAQNAEMKDQLARMQEQMAQLMAGVKPVAPEPVAPVQPENDDGEDVARSIFNTWDDATLKAFIKDKTGTAPRGTPSHETLVRMAEEANEAAREAA